MGIIRPQTTRIKISKKTIHKYDHLGFINLQVGDIVDVPIDELASCSQVKVMVVCDQCGKIVKKSWKSAKKNEDKSLPNLCKNCLSKNIGEQHTQRWFKETGKAPLYHDECWLRNEYITNKRTAKDIAIECGVSVVRIEKYLTRFNIHKTVDVHDLIDRDLLYDLHIGQGLSVRAISDLYEGVGVDSINSLFREYDIPRLSANELRKTWWSDPDNNAMMAKKRKALWQDDSYRTRTLAHTLDPDYQQRRSVISSAAAQGIPVSEWTGYILDENTRIRGSTEYAQWRKDVFERDNYTCQCCGARSSPGNPVWLNAHHIHSFSQYKDERLDVNNGITLCRKCHDPRMEGSLHNLYGTQDVTETQLYDYIDSYQQQNHLN